MASVPVETPVPPGSRGAALLAGASFHDCWSVIVPASPDSALQLFMMAASKTPWWIDGAMAARNQVVRWFGLKNLGHLSHLDPNRDPASYRPGDRVGIFTLFEQSFDEVLLGDRDKHLDVVLCVHRAPCGDGSTLRVSLTTVVHVKNLLGRLYMVPVTPAHRVIAPAMLARLVPRPGTA